MFSRVFEQYPSGIVKKRTVDGPRTDVNDITVYQYDTQGNLTSIENAKGHTTLLSDYDALGNLGKMVDANGLETRYVFDLDGKLLKQTVYNNSGTQVTEYEYNAMGQVTLTTYANGATLRNWYNSAYRLTKTSDAEGNGIYYNHNDNGDVISKTVKSKTLKEFKYVCEDPGIGLPGPGLNSVNYSTQGAGTIGNGECEWQWVISSKEYLKSTTDYDALARVKAKQGSNGQSVIYGYDDNSNLTTITDSLNRETTMEYNALNQLTSTTARDNGVTEYEYDSGGRVKSVTDPRGLKTEYHYDGFGDLIKLISPDTGTTIYGYNKSGQVIDKTKADDGYSYFDYDELGRLTYANQGGMATTYTYDSGTYKKGRLHKLNDSNGSTTFYYDKVGNVTRKTSQIGSRTYNTYYAHNNMNQVSQITYPSGHKINYDYDSEGRVAGVSYQNGFLVQPLASNIQYIPFGPMSRMNYGNGSLREISYDLDLRPTEIESGNVQKLRYRYDTENNITRITNYKNSSVTQNYVFDVESRLTDDISTAGGTNKYTYDKVGNRKTYKHNTNTTQQYIYPADSNQLKSVYHGAGSIYYNDNGHTRYKGGATFSYNGEDRLISHTKSGVTTSYQYNALGQRVGKQGSNGTSHYLYNESGQLIAEHNSSGLVQKEYVYLNGQVIGLIKNNTRYYVHNDHLGRAEKITNQSKNTVWQANNLAFDRSVTSNSIGDYNLGFPGQYWDSEKGSWYNYFRDYDAETGRYLQSDPIGLGGGENTYNYASLNPITRHDHFGLKDCDSSDEETFTDCLNKCLQQNYGQAYEWASYASPIGLFSVGASAFSDEAGRGLRAEGNRNSYGRGALNSNRSFETGRRQLLTFGQFSRFNAAMAVAGVGAFGFQIGANGYCAANCVSN